jgi:predicted glycoside hydrolase/deacetylase ChbG (UPF0249 family)
MAWQVVFSGAAVVLAGVVSASGGTALSPQGPASASRASVQERLGHPASARLLILHADDLGMSRSVNRATFEALEKGWITSASVLVACPWFPDVARWARANPTADLGIHLAVNSEWTGYRWGPLASRDAVPSLIDPDGYLPLVETTVVANARPAEVEKELRTQVDRARAAGLRISHIDSHMATLFRTPELFAVYRRMGTHYGVPTLLERLGERGGEASAWAVGPQADALVDRVISINPGVTAAGWPEAYEKMLAPLPPGVYQLILHLGYDDEEMRGATFDHPNWGAAWRQNDFDLVKSQRFRDFVKAQGFVLVTWGDLARAK